MSINNGVIGIRYISASINENMNEAQAKAYVSDKLVQSLAGYPIEANKLDCKLKWYDFQNDAGKNEFLKDASAIVNSYGGADGFLIIGYQDQQQRFEDAVLSDSSYYDDSNLITLVKGRVDSSFNLNVYQLDFQHPTNNQRHKLSIVHFPPSLGKPHVIKEYSQGNVKYPNEIFVRHGSVNSRASKADLDLIYSERPTIVVEKQLDITLRKKDITVHLSHNRQYIWLDIYLYFENLGLKVVDFLSLEIDFSLTTIGTPEDFKFLTVSFASAQMINNPFVRIIPDDPQQHRWSLNYYPPAHRIGDLETLIIAIKLAVKNDELKCKIIRVNEPNGNVMTIAPNIL
jgi:hypothetical protein